jgi:Mrp family chromosome partitioning ATPase/NifU-like protein involved in Fe-S cluster formation
MLDKDKILEVLSQINDPELHRSLTDLKMVREVRIQNGNVDVTIALTVPNCPFKSQIEADVHTAIAALPGVKQVSVKLTSMTDEERKAIFGEPKEGSAAPYNHVKRVIAVMSGKGGVGKSLVTSLLATALRRACYKVGILDADITGPSIPMLFGMHGPVEPGPVGVRPLESQTGIKVISMNLLLFNEDQPVIWRGPLVGRAITQLWGDVMWGDLDFLLVDLPPGTSDAALTTMQSLPVDGIIMVTTPQSLASMVVRKAVHMAQAVNTPIIGVVENMAYFTCPDTGKQHYIFGPSHVFEVIQTAGAPLLAQLPLDPQVASQCDEGKVEDIDLVEIPAFLDAFVSIYAPHAGSHKPGHRSFSEKARQLIESRENMGSLENPDARGFVRGWCGDSMQIDLRLKGEVIQEAQFITDGCGATIACGGMITRLIRSKTLGEAQQMTQDDLIAALDGLPDDHEHCAELAINTLHQAIKNAIDTQGSSG